MRNIYTFLGYHSFLKFLEIIRRFVSPLHWLFIARPVSPLTTCDRSRNFPCSLKSPRWHDDVRSVLVFPTRNHVLLRFSTRDNNEAEWLVSSSSSVLRTAGDKIRNDIGSLVLQFDGREKFVGSRFHYVSCTRVSVDIHGRIVHNLFGLNIFK